MTVCIDYMSEALDASSMLCLRKIEKSFVSMSGRSEFLRTSVLRELDFQLRAGSIIGVAGESGSGKTTLAKVATCVLKPDLGQIRLGSIDPFKLGREEHSYLRRWIRYVPQNPDSVLAPDLTVSEALAEARLYSRLDPDRQVTWQEKLGICALAHPSWLNRRIGDLSLGQRRRIVNLRALQSCPKYLFFDEPMNGIEAPSRLAFMSFLREMSRAETLGITIISHDILMLQTHCDIVFALDKGKLTRLRFRG